MNRTSFYVAFIGVAPAVDMKAFWSETAETFNGYTRSDVIGGWKDPSTGKLIEERAIRVEIVTDRPYLDVQDWARRAAVAYSQEYVLLTSLGALGSELISHPGLKPETISRA